MDGSHPKEHCFFMMHKMYEMREQPGLCDISIVVESKIFWAHKCVLVAACPTLQNAVIGEAETGPKENLQLTLQGLTCKGFEALLEYIYIGTPPSKKNYQLYEDFKKACRALGVREIPCIDINTGRTMVSTPVACYTDKRLVIEILTSSVADEDFGVDRIDKESEAPGVPVNIEVSRLQSESICCDLSAIETDMLNFHEQPDYAPVATENETVESAFGFDIGSVSQHAGEVTKKNDEEIDPLDISSLFSVTKRNGNPEDRTAGEDFPLMVVQEEDPGILSNSKGESLGIIRRRSRGRPRLPNDHLFPLKPPYVCPHQSCVKVCESREKLKKHYRNHEEKTHECDICGRKFLYKKDVIIHRRIHTGEKPYECATCGMCFTQKCILMNHIQTHAKGQKFFCQSCDKSYTSARSLGLHIREKHSNPIFSKKSCKICGGLSAVHTDGSTECSYVCTRCLDDQGKKFSCPSCDKSFMFARLLESHIRDKHSSANNGKPICEVCGETYYDDGPYLMHRDNGCSDECHLCLKCGLQFDHKTLFQAHIQECSNRYSRLKRRSQAPGFKCAMCGTLFNSKKAAMNHVQFTHDIYPVKDADIITILASMDEAASQKIQIIDFPKIMFEELVDADESSL